MVVHNFRNDGKTKAHAAFLGGHKRVEDLLAELAGNARAGIGEPHLDAVAPVTGSAAMVMSSVPPPASLMAS